MRTRKLTSADYRAIEARHRFDAAVEAVLPRWRELPRQMPKDLSLMIRVELDKQGVTYRLKTGETFTTT